MGNLNNKNMENKSFFEVSVCVTFMSTAFAFLSIYCSMNNVKYSYLNDPNITSLNTSGMYNNYYDYYDTNIMNNETRQEHNVFNFMDDITAAVLSLPISYIIDVYDGKVARALNKGERSGFSTLTDSIADIIAFGICPMILGISLGFTNIMDSLFLYFNLICGIYRLSRNFIIDENTNKNRIDYFNGFPMPMNTGIAYILFIDYWLFNSFFIKFETTLFGFAFHPACIIYAIFGYFLVSKIKIKKP